MSRGRRIGLPWWLTIGVTIVILVILAGAAQSVSKTFEFPRESVWKSYLLLVSLVAVSALVGAFVARFSAAQQIVSGQDEVAESLRTVSEQARAVGRACEELAGLPKQMGEREQGLERALASARELTNIALQRFGGLVLTYHDLKDIEDGVEEDGEIWILTSALQLEEDELEDVIISNLKKRVKYVYLLPREDRVLCNRMRGLAARWKARSGINAEQAQRQVRCFLVPSHFAYMTVVIYNPYRVPPTVLVKFPMSVIYQKEKYPLIWRVDTEPKEAWKTFVDAMQELIHPKRTCGQVEDLQFEFSDKA